MTVSPVKYFDQRWRLCRAGVVNVWHYYDTEFAITGGRLILRGANGSGKSRALEMLLPYLLDADRRRMDATGSNKVSLDELMRTGARDQTNRAGYLWMELTRAGEYLTIGAHVKYSGSAHRSDVQFFTTPLRVGYGLQLIDANRSPLSRDALSDLVGPHNLTDAEQHREVVRANVFGLRGESGRDRFAGLIQLLHTLRSPDVGNRIDEGRLPQILSDALPPLSEQTLSAAGEKLDNLTETRLAQDRLATTLDHVREFHKAYRSYAATVLMETAAAADHAATELLGSVKEVNGLEAGLGTLTAARNNADREQTTLNHEGEELRAAVDALEKHHIFKQADDLAQRDQAVAARRSAATQALGSARTARAAEEKAALRLNERQDDVRDAVRSAGQTLAAAMRALSRAGVAHSDLPEGISYSDSAAATASATVMDTLDGAPTVMDRPVVATVTVRPHELEPVRLVARRCFDASDRRRRQADRREQEAMRLASTLAQVRLLEATAETAAAQAQRDQDTAQDSAIHRDDVAIALNHRWREWISDETTRRILPDVEWADQFDIALLLEDIEALTGDDPAIASQLITLDSLCGIVAQPLRNARAVELNVLLQQQVDDDSERAGLDAERNDLQAQRDPTPPTGPWHSVHRGIPLWRTIDFNDDVPPADRSGLEAALLASGLLTATVDPDGSLRADDGEVVLSVARSSARLPLARAIQPDPSSEISTNVIGRILESIGLDDPDATTSIDSGGGWRNGALSGRYIQTEARHIGAAARAAARRARLSEIEVRLQELADRARGRTARRDAIFEAGRELDDHLTIAPHSRELADARATARAATNRAADSLARTREAEQAARKERDVWSGEFEQHRRACDGLSLPAGADDLRAATSACALAAEACHKLADECSTIASHVNRADTASVDFDDHVTRREEAETTAESERAVWHAAAAELAAQHDVLDIAVSELTAELKRTETAKRSTDEKLRAVSEKIEELRNKISQTQLEHVVAQQKFVDQRATMLERAARFNAQARLPGLVDAVSAVPFEVISDAQDAQHVRFVAGEALTLIGSRRPFTPTQLLNALARFQADTSGQLDVVPRFEHVVHLVHIEGADDHHDPTAVLTYLERRVAEGMQALTQREREVFTDFVLGSVADELRRRILQAHSLITAMNNSLTSTTTTHGIGVRIAWHLDKQEPDLQRILQLVSVADAVRSADDNDELIALLRNRVEQLHIADPSAGYAAHLAVALDYRLWHSVDVNIIGPEPGQNRRISRRAKISQGETRFVSYVTLFAAADGYLSSLPEADTALRLVLLDDAFAKIDERTIGELMGLLVRFDIDFVMTGHALWGTVPEVPQLDVYEIRRIGTSAAITTRIHWDGKHRHIHALTSR
jgi:uncharacterized protein (TIGR02680 family)